MRIWIVKVGITSGWSRIGEYESPLDAYEAYRSANQTSAYGIFPERIGVVSAENGAEINVHTLRAMAHVEAEVMNAVMASVVSTSAKIRERMEYAASGRASATPGEVHRAIERIAALVTRYVDSLAPLTITEGNEDAKG
jgi:hypothetical protein